MDNNDMHAKFLKTHEDAVLPTANNKTSLTGDSGYDLYAVEDVNIQSRSSATVPIGLTLADMTPGYWIRIEPRSGLGFKHNIQPHLGVIDNGYRGDLAVKLYNFGEGDYSVKKGDKIAQLVFYSLIQPEISFADQVTQTDRGDNGFGSSDAVATSEHMTIPPKPADLNFKNIEELSEFAKQTKMPSTVFDQLRRSIK